MNQQRRPAIFFDRDGVLNDDRGYVGTPDRFTWIEGSRECVKLVNDYGAFAFVVSNQAGVAHGYYSEDDVRSLHAHMQADLAAIGAHIDEFCYCPFHEKAKVEGYRRASRFRKPEPGMLLDLLARWPVDPDRSLMVGDQETDLEAARRAGIAARLVLPSRSTLAVVSEWLAACP
jgi:D-glycero-D-manno-heptose 1,7-bisphosphate phosphatase